MSIEVWTAQDLYNVRNNLNGSYVQMADIDLSEYPDWTPIGWSTRSPFKGSYDGAGYKITGLRCTNYYNGHGLFGVVEGGAIKNVVIEDAYVCGYVYAGILVAYARFGTKIRNCRVSGIVKTTNMPDVDGQGRGIGGLVGYGASSCEIEQCCSTGSVGHDSSIGECVGGLVGLIDDGSRIRNCYSLSSVTGCYGVGGLVGGAAATYPTYIINSYSAGPVSGEDTVGGLVGYGSITLNVESSYYDTETSGQSDVGKGTPKTTAEMMQAATFVGWDFENVWAIREGQSYPYFKPAGEPQLTVTYTCCAQVLTDARTGGRVTLL